MAKCSCALPHAPDPDKTPNQGNKMHTIVDTLATALRTEGADIRKTYDESEIMTQMRRQTDCSRSRGRPSSGPLITFIAAVVAILAVFGISTKTVNAAEPIQVGLITKTEVNPFFVKMRQTAAAVAEKHGAKLIARFGKFDGDNEGQVAAIENMARRDQDGYYYLAEAPTWSESARYIQADATPTRIGLHEPLGAELGRNSD